MNLPYIHEQLVQHEIIDPKEPMHFHLNMVDAPHFYNVGVLPKALRDRAISNLVKYQDGLTQSQGVEVTQFNLVINALQKDREEHLPEFLELTAQLDVIRGENFWSVYPELAELQNSSRPIEVENASR
jgi:hypothetical protein